jgi:hypothetical protein
MSMPPLTNVSSARGAPMGRPDIHPHFDRHHVCPHLELVRLRFVDGDYDEGGAYWGAPATVWRAYAELEDGELVDFYLRANNRAEAEAFAGRQYPKATFAPPEPVALVAQLVRGMALAFFASAYADQADECGQPLQGEIMNQLPDAIDPAALHAATTLHFDLERVNGRPLLELYIRHPGTTDDPQEWGHYAAMQAMGQGVGLRDYGITDEQVKVPYAEFGSHSLEQDYFQPVDDEDAEG